MGQRQFPHRWARHRRPMTRDETGKTEPEATAGTRRLASARELTWGGHGLGQWGWVVGTGQEQSCGHPPARAPLSCSQRGFQHPKQMAAELTPSPGTWGVPCPPVTSTPFPSHPVPPPGYVAIKITGFIDLLINSVEMQLGRAGGHCQPLTTGNSHQGGGTGPHHGEFWGARGKPSSGKAFHHHGAGPGVPQSITATPHPRGSPIGTHTGRGDTSWAVTVTPIIALWHVPFMSPPLAGPWGHPFSS